MRNACATWHMPTRQESDLPETDEQIAIRVISDRVAANDAEVTQARAVRKSKQAFLVKCQVTGSDALRYAVVTQEELDQAR